MTGQQDYFLDESEKVDKESWLKTGKIDDLGGWFEQSYPLNWYLNRRWDGDPIIQGLAPGRSKERHQTVTEYFDAVGTIFNPRYYPVDDLRAAICPVWHTTDDRFVYEIKEVGKQLAQRLGPGEGEDHIDVVLDRDLLTEVHDIPPVAVAAMTRFCHYHIDTREFILHPTVGFTSRSDFGIIHYGVLTREDEILAEAVGLFATWEDHTYTSRYELSILPLSEECPVYGEVVRIPGSDTDLHPLLAHFFPEQRIGGVLCLLTRCEAADW